MLSKYFFQRSVILAKGSHHCIYCRFWSLTSRILLSLQIEHIVTLFSSTSAAKASASGPEEINTRGLTCCENTIRINFMIKPRAQFLFCICVWMSYVIHNFMSTLLLLWSLSSQFSPQPRVTSHVLLYRMLLKDIGYTQRGAAPIYKDNRTCMKTAKNDMIYSWTKQIKQALLEVKQAHARWRQEKGCKSILESDVLLAFATHTCSFAVRYQPIPDHIPRYNELNQRTLMHWLEFQLTDLLDPEKYIPYQIVTDGQICAGEWVRKACQTCDITDCHRYVSSIVADRKRSG